MELRHEDVKYYPACRTKGHWQTLTFTRLLPSPFLSLKELKIERKGNQVLSFPKDCAAGQEAFAQLLIDNEQEGV